MNGTNFDIKNEDDRVEGSGGKFKRGHYDLVVFRPEFLEKCTYQIANGQNYEVLKHELPGILDDLKMAPVIAGIEVVFRRSPFASARDAKRWCKLVIQDCRKLNASFTWQGL